MLCMICLGVGEMFGSLFIGKLLDIFSQKICILIEIVFTLIAYGILITYNY